MRCQLLPCLVSDFAGCFPTLKQTKQLHALLITTTANNLTFHSLLATKLLRSYAAHHDVPSAALLFDQIPHRTVLLWNSLIRAHARLGDFSRSFSLLASMRRFGGAKPDGYTFACILRACAENSDPVGVAMLHGSMFSAGFVLVSISSTALVSAYSKTGLVDDAYRVFDEIPDRDLVAWNSMISGFAYLGNLCKCLELFRRMRCAGERPDGYTLVGLVSGIWDLDLAGLGEAIHGFCLKVGFESNSHVRSVLVSMYSRCNCLESASQLFRSWPEADLVIWSALVTGYSHAGKGEEAIGLFREMISSVAVKADSILIASVLSACASLPSIGPCKEVHGFALRCSIHSDIAVSCALIDAYSKCGFVDLGFRVFRTMSNRTLVVYNTVMSSIGSHGLGAEAIQIFKTMLDEGLKPDKATFSALLCACCHSGLEIEGQILFKRMHDEFNVEPEMEHYVYTVKLLGMAGQLQEAYNLIQAMPIMPDSGVWGALLWGCAVHRNRELGDIVALKLLEIEPRKAAYRVMLSNIYAVNEEWGDVSTLRNKIWKESLQKIPGLSWIES